MQRILFKILRTGIVTEKAHALEALPEVDVSLVEGDTQLDPAQASTVGQRFHADADILAVVGPAGSQEVLAVAPIFKKAQRLPFISAASWSAPRAWNW